jgi:hypothetical protein
LTLLESEQNTQRAQVQIVDGYPPYPLNPSTLPIDQIDQNIRKEKSYASEVKERERERESWNKGKDLNGVIRKRRE